MAPPRAPPSPSAVQLRRVEASPRGPIADLRSAARDLVGGADTHLLPSLPHEALYKPSCDASSGGSQLSRESGYSSSSPPPGPLNPIVHRYRSPTGQALSASPELGAHRIHGYSQAQQHQPAHQQPYGLVAPPPMLVALTTRTSSGDTASPPIRSSRTSETAARASAATRPSIATASARESLGPLEEVRHHLSPMASAAAAAPGSGPPVSPSRGLRRSVPSAPALHALDAQQSSPRLQQRPVPYHSELKVIGPAAAAVSGVASPSGPIKATARQAFALPAPAESPSTLPPLQRPPSRGPGSVIQVVGSAVTTTPSLMRMPLSA